jgi:hypothetical protein
MEKVELLGNMLVAVKALALLEQQDEKHLVLHVTLLNELLGKGREFGYRKMTREESLGLIKSLARNPQMVWSETLERLRSCGVSMVELLNAVATKPANH